MVKGYFIYDKYLKRVNQEMSDIMRNEWYNEKWGLI